MNMPETLRPALQLNNISEHLVHSELSYIIDLEKEFWKALPYTHTHTHTHTHREREKERERERERNTCREPCLLFSKVFVPCAQKQIQ
jgi:hypothetical protein